MTRPLDYAPHFDEPRHYRRWWVGSLVFVVVCALLFVSLKQQAPGLPTIPLSSFYQQVRNGNVQRVVIDGDEITGVLRGPVAIGGITVSSFRTYLPAGMSSNWAFAQSLMDFGGGAMEVRVDPSNNLLANFVLPFIPWLLILFFIWFLALRPLRAKAAQPQRPMPVVIVNPERPS